MEEVTGVGQMIDIIGTWIIGTSDTIWTKVAGIIPILLAVVGVFIVYEKMRIFILTQIAINNYDYDPDNDCYFD